MIKVSTSSEVLSSICWKVLWVLEPTSAILSSDLVMPNKEIYWNKNKNTTFDVNIQLEIELQVE